MKVCISPLGIPALFGNDPRSILEISQMAEHYGIDQLMLGDHVAMSDAIGQYPYGRFLVTPDHPFLEPITMLGAIAGVTKDIRLSTGVLISPLRPAVFLAKQLATLDVISGGRAEIGVGVGWQKEEYDALGIDWDQRYSLLEEQIKICRVLWTQAPASFDGPHTRFERLYSKPFPKQSNGIPILFGLKPTARNIQRIAELGDGWTPAPPLDGEPEALSKVISEIRRAFEANGRDPRSLIVRALPAAVMGEGGAPDADATIATIPSFIEAGVTMVTFRPATFCKHARDVEPFIEKIAAITKMEH